MSAKEQILSIINAQPEDSSFEQLLHELYLARVIELGEQDIAAGRVVSHDEAGRQIRSWQN